ncbi:putative mucin TcSMUG S, partial [Trypanosoma cruzi]
MMLRRVLCVLFFALCCACVCATAQEEGSMMLLMLRLGTARMKLQPPLQLLLLRRHDDYHQCTRQEHNHLQGTDSWRREQPRRPFVGSGAAAAAGQCPLWRPPVLRA